MSKTKFAFVAVAVAAFAMPAEAQIWKTVPGGSSSSNGERVIRRTEQVIEGRRCEVLVVERGAGRQTTERRCDWDRDGVYGDADDLRIEAQRGQSARRGQDRDVVRGDDRVWRGSDGQIYRRGDDGRVHRVEDGRYDSRSNSTEARARQKAAEKRAKAIEKANRKYEQDIRKADRKGRG